jgi:hypothetical protein
MSGTILTLAENEKNMQNGHKFGETAKAVIAGFIVVGGLVASSLPAAAVTTAPSTVDTTLVGSGSDTTYDMMKALDKVYAGANGCATIWYTGETQPFNGTCSTNDLASGNGAEKISYPWVNDGHTTGVQRYPVGSGNGVKELCYQGLANIRNVDYARSSSSSATTCSNLTFVAYAKDAVSWWHATKDKNGDATTSAKIASISKADLTKIYNGTYRVWSDLNGKAKDANGVVIDDLATRPIKRYTVQAGSGTLAYWTSNIVAPAASLPAVMSTPEPSATPSASPTEVAPASPLYSTVQENTALPIYEAGHEADAIYFYSYGRYKMNAGITGSPNSYFGNSVANTYPLAEDALGKIDDVAPTNTSLVASSGAFPLARNVFNVLRYPSAETLKFTGPSGFICSESIGNIKDRISGKTYRTLISDSILAEGFVPLPLGTTGGGQVGSSYCRVTASGSPTADVTAPTVGVDTGATYSGKASATFVFSEPVRSIDTSKFTAEGSVVTDTSATSGVYKSVVNGDLPVTVVCYNQKSVVVPSCASGSADSDPYQILSVKKVAVTISAAKANSVRFTAAAGAGTDLAGNTSGAYTAVTSTVSESGAGVSVKNTWAENTSATTNQAKTYTVKGANISISLTGGAYIYVDGVQVYNPTAVVNNPAVAAVYSGTRLVTPAKAAYSSYPTTGKIFTSGTFTLNANTAISAGGTATTRTNPIALSTKATWGGSGWHTVKVVVQAGPTAVTAISAS